MLITVHDLELVGIFLTIVNVDNNTEVVKVRYKERSLSLKVVTVHPKVLKPDRFFTPKLPHVKVFVSPCTQDVDLKCL